MWKECSGFIAKLFVESCALVKAARQTKVKTKRSFIGGFSSISFKLSVNLFL